MHVACGAALRLQFSTCFTIIQRASGQGYMSVYHESQRLDCELNNTMSGGINTPSCPKALCLMML